MADTAYADQDGFTEHYLRELEALRKEGADFAERYPKVAARLRLDDRSNPDPHVERLIESFAFLTARVQRKLDDEFPELGDALLEVLYPHLARPIPSMAIAEVGLDLEQSVPTGGLLIERGTTFLSRPANGEPLRFRSTSDLRLWPLAVEEAEILPPSANEMERYPDARAALRLRIGCRSEQSIGEMELESLRTFLKGEARTVADLYELFCTDLIGITVATEGTRRGSGFDLPTSALASHGFGPEEAMLPYPKRSFSGYRLIQEYFAFPAKFHFFDIGGLERLWESPSRSLELRLVFSREPRIPHANVTADNFSLSCVPLVNLFEINADPILLNPFVSEHDVVPDAQRPLDLEVYAISEVTGISPDSHVRFEYAPFYSVHHDTQPGSIRAYWHTRRRASRRKGDRGTDVSLALVDLDLQHVRREDETLHVRVVCTNRDLPAQVSGWGAVDDFRPEGITGIANVRCVRAPTRTLRPTLSGAAQWRLLSQLSLNHLSLVREGRDALCEILRTYDITGIAENREQIEGIREVSSVPTVRWLESAAGGGFARGTQTTLTLDRDRFVGSCPLLFAGVIERFLALYCAINSFSEMRLETPQEQGEVYRWNPRAGDRVLL